MENYIDLGLSVLWSDKNVGAETEYDFGDYFDYDSAISMDEFRIPTKAEWQELQNKCTVKYDGENNGFEITGPNGNSIFLPVGGDAGKSFDDKEMGAAFWSSTVCTWDDSMAFYAYFVKKVYEKTYKHNISCMDRLKYYISLRLVKDKTE